MKTNQFIQVRPEQLHETIVSGVNAKLDEPKTNNFKTGNTNKKN